MLQCYHSLNPRGGRPRTTFPADRPSGWWCSGQAGGSLSSTPALQPQQLLQEPLCPAGSLWFPGALESCEELVLWDNFQLEVYETTLKKKSHLNFPGRPVLPSSRVLWFPQTNSAVPPERPVGEKARYVVRKLSHLVKGRIVACSIKYMINVHHLSPLLSVFSAQRQVISGMFQLTSRLNVFRL